MDRGEGKAVREQIRVVEEILRRWDPIGVIPDRSDAGGPLDEYDSYAPGILGKLRAGASVDDLTRHLYGLATTQMGLPGNIERDRLFAAELFSWWVNRSGVA
jgi:hypothetical protein